MLALKGTWQTESLARGEKSVNAIVAACIIASGTVISPNILPRKPFKISIFIFSLSEFEESSYDDQFMGRASE